MTKLRDTNWLDSSHFKEMDDRSRKDESCITCERIARIVADLTPERRIIGATFE